MAIKRKNNGSSENSLQFNQQLLGRKRWFPLIADELEQTLWGMNSKGEFLAIDAYMSKGATYQEGIFEVLAEDGLYMGIELQNGGFDEDMENFFKKYPEKSLEFRQKLKDMKNIDSA